MTLDTQYYYKSFQQTVVKKKRKSACASMCSTPAGGLHSPLANEQDTTGPARAQLRTFFSNVWRDRQGAGQLHLSTR